MAAVRAVQGASSAATARGERLSGQQAWRLLWAASTPLSLGVLAWAALDAIDGPLVVGALGFQRLRAFTSWQSATTEYQRTLLASPYSAVGCPPD